jgi:hypothetical protein
MRIETKRVDAPVHVVPSGDEIRLRIGTAEGDGCRFTRLSLTQADMVLDALGRAVAEIRQRQCLLSPEPSRAHPGSTVEEP